MKNNSRENILTRIKQALKKPVPVPFPAHENAAFPIQPAEQELELLFAENFSKLQGKFCFCINPAELAIQLQQLLEQRKWTKIFCVEDALKSALQLHGLEPEYSNHLASADLSITSCEHLIARTGSILMSSAEASGRTASVYAPVHICIAYTDQLVYDIGDGLNGLLEKYQLELPSLITLASGPSRTADIEKTLVVGVHGPKEVFCFLVDRQQ